MAEKKSTQDECVKWVLASEYKRRPELAERFVGWVKLIDRGQEVLFAKVRVVKRQERDDG